MIFRIQWKAIVLVTLCLSLVQVVMQVSAQTVQSQLGSKAEKGTFQCFILKA